MWYFIFCFNTTIEIHWASEISPQFCHEDIVIRINGSDGCVDYVVHCTKLSECSYMSKLFEFKTAKVRLLPQKIESRTIVQVFKSYEITCDFKQETLKSALSYIYGISLSDNDISDSLNIIECLNFFGLPEGQILYLIKQVKIQMQDQFLEGFLKDYLFSQSGKTAQDLLYYFYLDFLPETQNHLRQVDWIKKLGDFNYLGKVINNENMLVLYLDKPQEKWGCQLNFTSKYKDMIYPQLEIKVSKNTEITLDIKVFNINPLSNRTPCGSLVRKFHETLKAKSEAYTECRDIGSLISKLVITVVYDKVPVIDSKQ